MPTFTVFKGSKDGAIVKSSTTKSDDLEGDQVLVKITASGLCYTDLHYKTQDMVLGHEGIGRVEAIGPKVKELTVGDRVGWGYEHDCCGGCKHCLTGWETFCPDRAMYAEADLDQGSFASQAVWKETFLFKIPDSLSDVDAAPLQCAGSTVFNALQGVGSSDVVAVMGVGGLGHLALQFAAKLGCRVVAISGSDSKRDEAMKLGAHEFIATKNAKELKVEKKITRLIVTTSAQPDWEKLLPILDRQAGIYPLSVDPGKFELPYMPLLVNGIKVQGGIVGTRAVHRNMLDFAGQHDIKPVTETFPLNEKGIKEAMSKLEAGEVRYRAVLLNKE
ncbi:chaperonin 10-like protein [Kockovaella imperatae]|uniref:Chaperonin 10-like protein n=1 Tax=Kockovaella imperatae TaxID=4999 RepID=A0A1Y1UBG1_9TREE|nr:chaperonin 10-like protein [Kockovaella imperatae]ORX34857.1 chaperonin 10-like protein [Kockovaella imperatae]